MGQPKIRARHQIFWIALSKIWKEWRNALILVKPNTVIHWQKKVSSCFGDSNPGKEGLEGPDWNPKQKGSLKTWPKPIHCGEPLGFMASL